MLVHSVKLRKKNKGFFVLLFTEYILPHNESSQKMTQVSPLAKKNQHRIILTNVTSMKVSVLEN